MADSFYESFDNGTGALTNVWGDGADTSVKGQITIDGHGGAMQHASGSGVGFGYGDFTVTAEVEGNTSGPAALLWPADDKWPGTEMDFVEVLDNGTAYATAHRDQNGSDWYEARDYKGLDESQVHTYGIAWRPDEVAFSVDGNHTHTIEWETKDAAHGGSNVVFALMNMDPHTSITVYDMSYSPW